MKLKGGLGADIRKEDHPDHAKNVKYFKENYVDANPERQKNIYLYMATDEMVAWIGFSAPKGKAMYSVAHPVPVHQGYYAFVNECKEALVSVNNWAWKEIKTLQDYESKRKNKEEKL